MKEKNILEAIFLMGIWILLGFQMDVYGQGSEEDRWFRESYRKLFFDFHTQQSVKDVAQGFDAEKWAEELAKDEVQAISVHAVDFYGWRFYRKGSYGYIHPHLRRGGILWKR